MSMPRHFLRACIPHKKDNVILKLDHSDHILGMGNVKFFNNNLHHHMYNTVFRSCSRTLAVWAAPKRIPGVQNVRSRQFSGIWVSSIQAL